MAKPAFVMARKIDWMGLILISATFLNAALAFANNQIFPINASIASAAQLAVTTAAVAITLLRYPRLPLRFWAALSCLGLLTLMVSFWNNLNAKHFYDLLVIPCFIAFGTVVRCFPLKAFKIIFGAVSVITFLDVFAVGLYTALLDPLSYFRNTRVWVANQLPAGSDEAGLYLGANRGGGMFFSFLTDHRAGGPFLEPLSLGYFAVVSSMLFAIWLRYHPIERTLAFGACLILALLADSRVAAAMVMAFFGISCVQPLVRRWWSSVAPIILLLSAFIFYIASEGRNAVSETPRRIAITFDALLDSPLVELFNGVLSTTQFGDSGILYLIHAATLPGMFICLYLFSGQMNQTRLAQPLIPLMASIYLTTTALFGGAFLSIKTSALLGLIIGAASVGALPMKAKRMRASRGGSLGRLASLGSA